MNLFLDRSTCSLTPFSSFLLAPKNKVRCLNVVNFMAIACFLSFLGPRRCALSIFKPGIYKFLLFFHLSPGSFLRFHSFHMEWWLFLDRSFDCIVDCIRPNVQGCYIFWSATELSVSVSTWFWSKLKVEESFSISCSSSLIIGLISSLKTFRKLDFICPLKVSLNSSTFSSTAALNSSVLRVLSISK